MGGTNRIFTSSVQPAALAMGALLATLTFAAPALAAPGTVNVTVTSSAAPIDVGFRWLLEEDATWDVTPALTNPGAGDPLAPTLATSLHTSHMPVVAQGNSASASAAIPVPNTSKRYFLSILPDQGDAPPGTARDCATPGQCYTQSGRQVTPDMFTGSTATLVVNLPGQPVPTAQIYGIAFEDSAPINGVIDPGERPLGGWTVFIYDMGGQMMADTFGHPLGTVYDGDGNVVRLGDGTLHTLTEAEAADPARNPYGIGVGEVLVKGIAPGKYGIQMVPPAGQKWQQTSTLEGTKGIDVWVKANEPRFLANFGTGYHAFIGFVSTDDALNTFPKSGDADYAFTGGNTITGTVKDLRMARPPDVSTSAGQPLADPLSRCWVGLNNAAATRGLVAKPCNDDASFSIGGLADGTYELVVFDAYLDYVIAFQTVILNGGTSGNLGDVQVNRWFGSLEHTVFNDLNENGVRDEGENGIPDQVVNLRFRDGSIYNSSTTDTTGFLPFDEIFPFFSWLVAEVDYARFKATGVTVTVDAGGPVVNNAFGLGKLNPQTQNPSECALGSDTTAERPGLCQARTELASDGVPPLLEGYDSYFTTNVFEWGKKAWGPGENGGITGVVYYQTTRAENDPRFAAPEPWEPGIPRVQVALYFADSTGRLYHNDGGVRGAMAGLGSPIDLADVDNYPLGNFPGPEDIDNHPGSVAFQLGDAIEVAHTDSWDDSLPEGCRPQQDANGNPTPDNLDVAFPGKCADSWRNYSQVRPAVFDGGFAFGKPFTDTPIANGYYVVQASPPRGPYGETYQIQQEEDKNVDFGDTMKISPQALPPSCVGGVATDGTVLDNGVAPHDTGNFLQLFSTPDGPIDIDPAVQGAQRPGCDFRLVQVTDGKNAAVDFFMFTETPITGHIRGMLFNDIGAEFNPASPFFGEGTTPAYAPISVRDYEGNEVYHTYSDRWGAYNAVVPTSFRINTPMPSGVSPNMVQVCLNSKIIQDANGDWHKDPRHNPQYAEVCYTYDFKPGQTTYLDTPTLPLSAFVSSTGWQLDCDYPSGTPVIFMANSSDRGPYIPASASGTGRHLVIESIGDTQVLDPLADIYNSANRPTVTRDFGFGASAGRVWIGGKEITGSDLVQWSNGQITVNVPLGTASGQLRIRRANGMETVHGLTVTVDQAGLTPTVVHDVRAGQSIQAAIDSANPGDLVMVRPGTYTESLIMTKPVRLQGWGAGAVTVNPVTAPYEKLALQREKLNYLVNCTHELGLLPGQTNNTPGSGPCGFVPGTGLLELEETAGILVAPIAGAFGSRAARIDGFTISGSQAAGILVNGYATGLEISNNIVSGNQGPYAAGIRAGQVLLLATNAPEDGQNDGLRIHHNHVSENGGLGTAGGGIGLYTGSDGYQVNRNYVCGNYSNGNGAGISHYGLSGGGQIVDNRILFNQAKDQTVTNSGNGGGIAVQGYALAADVPVQGTGNVTIDRNVIRGNGAGSGNGGGIDVQAVGGTYLVRIENNLIANNVAGYKAGGIAMDDATHVRIVNNTIVNNDSTATAAAAACVRPAGPQVISCPQGAGVYALVGNIGSANFRNNIILGNRAMHVELFEATPDPAAPLDPRLVFDGYADLEGAGLYTGGLNGTDGIRNSLLSSTNVVTPPTNYCSSTTSGQAAVVRGNTCLAPSSVEASHFVDAYWNRGPSFGDPLQSPEAASYGPTVRLPKIAFNVGEGGNYVDVDFGPLSAVICDPTRETCAGTPPLTPTEVLGDYHLLATATDAINRTLCTGGTSTQRTACSGNISATPSIDVDGQLRLKTAADAADRGADEYYAGYTAGTTPINNLANLAPVMPAISPLTALAKAAFSYQAQASDPNGDPLQFRLCNDSTSNSNCNSSPIPTGLSVDAASGVVTWVTPNWTSGSLSLPGCSGNGNTRTCRARVQVSDNSFGGGLVTCATTNCAWQRIAITLRRYDGNGPTAINDSYDVTTMGTFSVPGPGVLGNDTNNLAGYATLTAPLSAFTDGTAANGKLTFAPDGSFTFIPNAGWAGSTTFTYRAFDGVILSTQPASNGGTATVTLNRQIGVTSARYISGAWTFIGVGSIDGRYIRIVRDRGGVDITPATVTARPVVAGGAWALTLAGGPDYQFGDTVTITSTDNSGGGAFSLLAVPVLSGAADDVISTAHVQCPLDGILNPNDKDGLISTAEEDFGKAMNPPVVCKHLAAGDGWSVMADGQELYTFGFNDVSKVTSNAAIAKGILNAQFPGPTLDFDEGDEVYLTLTNVGMLLRPDLFDPHSVHFHGFPNAAAVFDGVPEASITINMGFSYTYYYKTLDPGTYMYHCHVEAAEHMQMGMLGNLYVRPKQNGTNISYGGKTYNKFVYNDGDGSTGYDVEYPIQIGSFDGNFHVQHIGVQPLPFAEMHDDYPMLNGRGYPDTVNTGVLPAAPSKSDPELGIVSGSETSQPMNTRIVITKGQKALLRISNLNVTRFYTLSTNGLPMEVVGTGAHILRGPDGQNMYYTTNSVTLGGGEGVDVMIDTTNVDPGTYLLYSTNLESLSNGAEDFGGMMTEIVVQ